MATAPTIVAKENLSVLSIFLDIRYPLPRIFDNKCESGGGEFDRKIYIMSNSRGFARPLGGGGNN